MRKAAKTHQVLALALILAGASAGAGRMSGASKPEASKENVQVMVRVFNRVHLPMEKMAQAEDIATQILQQAGVQVRWMDCTIPYPGGEPSPVCDLPMGQSLLNLNFVEEIRSLSHRMKDGTLGFAMVPENGELGETAYVSIQRARNSARECVTSTEMILGLAAAHEIGHLLMNSGDHSSSGVMRARWDARDMKRAEMGDLRFNDDQLRRIYAGASMREVASR